MKQKVILRVDDWDKSYLALQAARSLDESGYNDCVYAYEDGTTVWAKRYKSSITATTQDFYARK